MREDLVLAHMSIPTTTAGKSVWKQGGRPGTHVGEIGERIEHLLFATPSCWIFNQLP